MNKQQTVNKWIRSEMPHNRRVNIWQGEEQKSYQSRYVYKANLSSRFTDSSANIYPDKDRHAEDESMQTFMIWELEEIGGEGVIYKMLGDYTCESLANAEKVLMTLIPVCNDEMVDPAYPYDHMDYPAIKEAFDAIKELLIFDEDEDDLDS